VASHGQRQGENTELMSDALSHRQDIQWLGRVECSRPPAQPGELLEQLCANCGDALPVPVDRFAYRPRTTLYRQDTAGNAVFTITSGLVALVQQTPWGVERVVRLAHPGDTLGLELLVDGRYRHTAAAARRTEVSRIPLVLVNATQRRHPGMAGSLLRSLQKSADEADRFLTSFATGPAPARLARLMLHLGERHGGGDTSRLSREVIANTLGITLETASRIMNDFKRRGLMFEERGTIGFTNRAALEEIAWENRRPPPPTEGT